MVKILSDSRSPLTPHLCVQQVEVFHGLFHPSLASDLRSATLWTNQVIDTLLFNGRRKKGLKTRLTQETGAVSHGDDLQEVKTEEEEKGAVNHGDDVQEVQTEEEETGAVNHGEYLQEVQIEQAE